MMTPHATTGDVITFSNTNSNAGKRLRSLLQSGQGAEGNTSLSDFFVPSEFTLAARPTKPSGFNPQNGTVTLNTVVFMINVAGAVPNISPAVSWAPSDTDTSARNN